MSTITLSALYTYPIKSARGVSLLESAVGPYGLDLDRHWMVVDSLNRGVTGRQHPRLLLVEISLEPDGLALQAPGMPDLRVPYTPQGVAGRVTLWSIPLEGVEVSAEVSGWFSSYLGGAFRLFKFSDHSNRRMNPLFGDAPIAFPDGNPLHLISESSLIDLNSRLTLPITAQRFRPNIVVYGSEPYLEDNWKQVRIGTLECAVVEATARCGMVNFTHGQVMPEPLRTLARYRRNGRQILFGQNLVHAQQGVLRVGEELSVLEVGEDNCHWAAADSKKGFTQGELTNG